MTALALAGCASDEDDSAAPTTTAATTTPETTAGEEDPLRDANTDPVAGEADVKETALLERVALAHHPGYDRVVFQFRQGLPAYRVEYVEPPLHEDGSGNPVELDGNAFLVVRLEPASGFDLSVAEGELVYTGPRRITGTSAGTLSVVELVRTGDFEAVLTWAVGLAERVPFRVLALRDPGRIVVDFRAVAG